MNVEVTSTAPAEVEADTLALVAGGLLVRKPDALFEGRLTRSAADADPIAVVHVGRELRARRILLVATDGLDPEHLRTATARAVRATPGAGAPGGGQPGDGVARVGARRHAADGRGAPASDDRRGRRARQLRREALEERGG